MTKVKKTNLSTLVKRFKEEHKDLYDEAYKKTLQDAFDTDHDTHESFRRLRARNCNSCDQLSAFFYGNVCWRCHYAKEFYAMEEDIEASASVRRTIYERPRLLKKQSSSDLSNLLQNISNHDSSYILIIKQDSSTTVIGRLRKGNGDSSYRRRVRCT